MLSTLENIEFQIKWQSDLVGCCVCSDRHSAQAKMRHCIMFWAKEMDSKNQSLSHIPSFEPENDSYYTDLHFIPTRIKPINHKAFDSQIITMWLDGVSCNKGRYFQRVRAQSRKNDSEK